MIAHECHDCGDGAWISLPRGYTLVDRYLCTECLEARGYDSEGGPLL